jgi:triosephosphate isomerase
MENGKVFLTLIQGVNFRNFGAFTCEVFSEHVKPAQLSNFDITKELEDQRL